MKNKKLKKRFFEYHKETILISNIVKLSWKVDGHHWDFELVS
jgi:hypothetical protein